VVAVGVRDRVRRYRATAKRLDDPTGLHPQTGVHQHVTYKVSVDESSRREH